MTTYKAKLLAMLCGSALVVPAALACGDKVAALGGGIPFERFQATHLNGQVVLLMSQGSGLRRIDEQAGLAKALEFAGHTVRVVDNAQMLETELLISPANIVIADQGDVSRVAAGVRSMSKPPALLVVVSAQSAGSGGVASACVIRSDLRQSRTVVRSVDQLVAKQSRGSRGDCLPTA